MGCPHSRRAGYKYRCQRESQQTSPDQTPIRTRHSGAPEHSRYYRQVPVPAPGTPLLSPSALSFTFPSSLPHFLLVWVCACVNVCLYARVSLIGRPRLQTPGGQALLGGDFYLPPWRGFSGGS